LSWGLEKVGFPTFLKTLTPDGFKNESDCVCLRLCCSRGQVVLFFDAQRSILRIFVPKRAYIGKTVCEALISPTKKRLLPKKDFTLSSGFLACNPMAQLFYVG
jgi:hypothetical protein